MKLIALFLASLIIMLPVCFAAELNLVYDANGNLLSGDGYVRTYNSLNQLAEIRNSTGSLLEEFSYHPVEERILVKKTYTNLVLSETVYYVDENFVRVINSSGTYDYTYVKHEGQLVAQLNPDGSKYYVHGDHEGSTSTITNSSGNIVETTTYSPYGEIISGGSISRFDSEGKEYDSVVGDYDFHFRKYNPSWGLFLQPDTLIPNVYDPQSLNRYMFERGNPYGNKDEKGHDLILTIAIITFVVLDIITIIAELYAKPKVAAIERARLEQEKKETKEDIRTEPAIHAVTPEQIEARKKAKYENEVKELPEEFKIKEPYKEIMNQVNIRDKTKEKIEAPVYGRSKGGTRAVPVYIKSDGTVVWGASGSKVPEGTTPSPQASKNLKQR